MSFTKTLTATVAALYLGIGNAGAEEPKSQKRQLSCSKEWNDLLTIVSTDGSIGKNNDNFIVGDDDTSYLVMQLKLQLSKYSSVVIEYEAENCENGAIRVSEKNKKNASGKLTCFYIKKSELKSVSVDVGVTKVYRSSEEPLDLSNPRIRQAAERTFCGYVKQAAAKYEKDKRQVKDDKVQKQLDLLK